MLTPSVSWLLVSAMAEVQGSGKASCVSGVQQGLQCRHGSQGTPHFPSLISISRSANSGMNIRIWLQELL